MPELPEVETVMRGLATRLQGRVIVRATTHRADMRWAFPPDLAQRLSGTRVLSFRRRGKYILMRIDGGASVLLHLGMSGRMLIVPAVDGAAPDRHEHVSLLTDDGWRVAFIDPRRFGSVDLVATAAEDSHRLLAGLGPEPLEPGFDAALLRASLAGRRTPLRAALLDQRVVAGLGNIYVAEALFRARFSPRRRAYTVGLRRAERLACAIRETLGDAIAAGGSSLRDYVQPGGELGYFQHAWRVYGRAGQPCPDCPGPAICQGIRRETQGGRSSFWCPRLQR